MVFANCVSDKELIPRIYKESVQVKSKNQITQFKKIGKGSEFLQRRYTNSQHTCEKMFNLTRIYRNAIERVDPKNSYCKNDCFLSFLSIVSIQEDEC